MEDTYRKTSAERQKEIVQAVLRIIGRQGVTSLATITIAKEVEITS
jgi:DNA-binding transcriptional regulator YbjK